MTDMGGTFGNDDTVETQCNKDVSIASLRTSAVLCITKKCKKRGGWVCTSLSCMACSLIHRPLAYINSISYRTFYRTLSDYAIAKLIYKGTD